MWKNFSRSNFWIKFRSWEYWPFGIVQFPIFIYWMWLSLKARSVFFFSASNPGIPTGGMIGESKFDILRGIPDTLKPKTLLVKIPSSKDVVLSLLAENGLTLPVIFKPDLGERGWMVRIIRTEDDIQRYLDETRVEFIIQELVSLPFEFGVFYVRYPDSTKGFVNSITMKEFLHVVGDGEKTLEELILEQDRAKLQWSSLRKTHQGNLRRVVPKDEKMMLVPIGNHCLGTKFLNANHLINEKLIDSFDNISKQLTGFYFGRYDLRCASLEDLEAGRVKILELNGCGAEPAHIYQPGFSLYKALGVLFTHWRNLYIISAQNHARGVPYMTVKEGLRFYRQFKAVKAGQ